MRTGNRGHSLVCWWERWPSGKQLCSKGLWSLHGSQTEHKPTPKAAQSPGCTQECCWWDEGGDLPLGSALMWEHPKHCVHSVHRLSSTRDIRTGERRQWRVYTYLKKQSKQDGARFFSVVPPGSTGAKRQSLKTQDSPSECQETLFSVRVTEHWYWQDRPSRTDDGLCFNL